MYVGDSLSLITVPLYRRDYKFFLLLFYFIIMYSLHYDIPFYELLGQIIIIMLKISYLLIH